MQKIDRREERGQVTGVDGFDHAADQAHVVVEGRPHQAGASGREGKGGVNHGGVVQHVGVGNHHPFGRASGAGGVLQESQRRWFRHLFLPIQRLGGVNRIGCQPAQLLHGAYVLRTGGSRGNFCRGQRERCLRICRDRHKPEIKPVGAGGIEWRCHHTGIETAVKSGNKFQPKGVEQQGAFPRGALLLQQGCNGSRLAIQSAIGYELRRLACVCL